MLTTLILTFQYPLIPFIVLKVIRKSNFQKMVFGLPIEKLVHTLFQELIINYSHWLTKKVGMYKTIISLLIWPLWYFLFVPSLILLFIPIILLPRKKLYLIVRPVCWIWCLLAGQWLKKENNPPPIKGQPYLYLFRSLESFPYIISFI